MAIFRLLHVSDLHIASKPDRVGLSDIPTAGMRLPRDLSLLAKASSYSPDLLDGLIEYVYDQGERFDAVLLSGDLATTGEHEDLDQARCCIDGEADGLWYNSPRAGRLAITSHRSLKRAGRQILLLPGNHDRFDGPRFRPGGTLFDKFFFGYWKVGQGVKAWISPPKEGTRLGLLSADLSLREGDEGTGSWGRYGQGRAYDDIINQMETLTDDLRTEFSDLVLLWVVHFPPAYPQIDDALQLLDGKALIQAAQGKRITYILAGHTHSPLAYTATSGAGPVKVLCAGTATQEVAPEGHFIHELEIEVALTSTTSYRSCRWHEAEQKWVRSDSMSWSWEVF